MSGLIARWRRAAEFARHIPPAQVAHRALAIMRRRAADVGLLGRNLPSPGRLGLSPRPPLPLFPPRTGSIRRNGTDVELSFLGRSRPLDEGLMSARMGGVRADQLWLMNLHYMEYLEEADTGTFEALVDAWLSAAHPSARGSWADCWNSYAVSLRTVVWCQQLAARPALSPELRDRMVESLSRQLEYLSRRLELDLGGNHLVKNAKALAWGAAFFEGPTADRWRRVAVELLGRILQSQILPDGMHDERSPAYHAQVFADLLESRWAIGPGVLDQAFECALPAMARAVADLAHPDGRCAQFNDAGLSMAYEPALCLAAFTRTTGLPAPSPRAAFSFPHAGYFGWRRGDDLLIVDCGPIGPDHLPAHAHADVLSFELSVGGHRLIVDQGVYEYVAGPRRSASRSATHHNTLCLEGADQADFFGDFRVGRRPRPQVEAVEVSPDGLRLVGSHDGFEHMPGRPRHRRRFEAGLGHLEIIDEVLGGSDRAAQLNFLIHPDWTVHAMGSNGAMLERNGISVELACEAEIMPTDAVWWPDMGEELPTTALRLRLAAGAIRHRTTISWLRPDH